MNDQTKTAAIVLCAGESRRMGTPKAYLPFRGGTFLSVIAETLGAFAAPVIAVFGCDAPRLAAMAPEGVLPVVNPDYELGMLTSLQAGLRALPAGCGRVLFTLVDHPAVKRETVAMLLRSESAIAIPRCRGKRGHPVLAQRGIFGEFLAEPLSAKVRDVIDRHAAEIEYIEVEDPGVCDDIDDPLLYESLLAREAVEA